MNNFAQTPAKPCDIFPVLGQVTSEAHNYSTQVDNKLSININLAKFQFLKTGLTCNKICTHRIKLFLNMQMSINWYRLLGALDSLLVREF